MNKLVLNKLLGSDFSAIEDRVGAWLPDPPEDWKVAAYSKFDATGDFGFEPYCILGAAIYGINDRSVMTKKHPARKLGKVMSLAFQFGGGLPAFRKQEAIYNLSEIKKSTDSEVFKLRDQWREQHPSIAQFWDDILKAAMDAVRNPGQEFPCGRIKYICNGRYLFAELPSCGRLVYPYPQIIISQGKRGPQKGLGFRNNKDGKWVTCYAGDGVSYGGPLFENLVSTISRDILAATMMRLEKAGYRVVLTIHDQLVCEVPESFGSLEEFKQLMTETPSWSEGLPIAANCWTGQRFSKGD